MVPLSPKLKANDADLIAAFGSLRNLADVAHMLEIDASYLRRILYVRRERENYRSFSVLKRSGKIRTISAPPKALRILQQKLNRVFGLVYSPKTCVHGFTAARSILSNAAPHAGKRWVLNIDLEDFFPSIHLGRVAGALSAPPYRIGKKAAMVVAQICTTGDGKLPQGAPTSPILSNIVCGRLDGELTALAKRHGMAYTRYCDDISLSSRRIEFPHDVAEAGSGWLGDGVVIGPVLNEVIGRNGFAINVSKTRLQLRSCHQEVTGLTVNEFANVSRHFVRGIRVLLHKWRKHGPATAARIYCSHDNRSPEFDDPERRFRRIVRGRIEYIGMVRGHTDPVYCRLRGALHELDKSAIGPAPKPSNYRLPRSDHSGDRWSRLFARWQAGVFHLIATQENGDIGSGTAFGWGSRSVATAAHNLARSRVVEIRSPAESWSVPFARIHPRGPSEIDCALLEVPHGAERFAFSARIPSPGESIAIVGFATVPQRQPGVGLYVGTVESIRWNYARTTEFIHVSVASGGGLSGSPAFDGSGRLTGIVVESVFEQTRDAVPHREYCTVLPIQYALEIDPNGAAVELPVVD